jgi:serine/threonine-protein kinase HipA
MNRQGEVYYQDRLAGIISELDEGYRFDYLASYLALPEARPISLTLPMRPDPYTSKELFPFFDGLIPEGWLLDIVLQNWKLDSRDRMGLLLTVCHDCVGAVSVRLLVTNPPLE